MMNELRQILTAEQLEKFEQLRESRRGMKGRRGSRRGGFGPHTPVDCPHAAPAPESAGE
jgi:hypothetical protein